MTYVQCPKPPVLMERYRTSPPSTHTSGDTTTTTSTTTTAVEERQQRIWHDAELARQRALLGEINKKGQVFVDYHMTKVNKELAAKTLLWSNCLAAYNIKSRFLDRKELWMAVGDVVRCASVTKLLTAVYLGNVIEPFNVDCDSIMEPAALRVILTAVYKNDSERAFKEVEELMANSDYHRSNTASKASFLKDCRVFDGGRGMFAKVLFQRYNVDVDRLYKKCGRRRFKKYRLSKSVINLYRLAPKNVRVKCQQGVRDDFDLEGDQCKCSKYNNHLKTFLKHPKFH